MEFIDFSQEKFEIFCEEVRKKAPSAKFVPISSTRSENITKSSKYMPWWKKGTLIETALAFSKEVISFPILNRK